MSRVSSVVLLLRSLGDVSFGARTWSGSLARQGVAGEGPSRRLECASCRGEGEVRRRGVPVPCEVCGARGWLVVDAYTERPIGTAETGVVRRVRAVRCDACGGAGAFGNERRCGRCGGSGWLEVSVGVVGLGRAGGFATGFEFGPGDLLVRSLDEGFAGLGQAYRRRVLAGSFDELEAALESLKVVDRLRFRLVWGTFVDAVREPEELGVGSRVRLWSGVDFLVERMPEVIRVPSWAARNERRRRDRLKRKEAA